MSKIQLEVRTREFKEVFIKQENKVVQLDNVLNTLTILLCTEKKDTEIQDKDTANYLLSQKLIKESRPGRYQMTDREECEKVSDALSNYMEQLLTNM